MPDTQPDTHCIFSIVDYNTAEGHEHEMVAIRCKFTIGRRRRWIASVPRRTARKCREKCKRFEPRDKYDLDACKRLMARVLKPWLPHADHFIYDYLGIEREDVVRRRTR